MQEIVIDSEEIKEYFFKGLLQEGYVPTEEEAEVLADICFDYLVDLGIIESYEEY